ncbi:pyrroloquinoline quinone biosynthesis protein PqqE [Pseudonocardia acaciae]|uniref:pyrroloquinoline quinone biosynthesis protein PqqE n=1 Tax=Pseudonocardia acaciae TaxID=551276 RepID=UPI0004919CBE|nr:pyrroloquinoline quinone biosynthesis protein PqqE [Pseudonocardia acaciae]
MAADPPLGLLAELTHRCPLKCAYCSNPLELVTRSAELDTEAWRDVIGQASDLGVLQVHLSGGEPLLRPDLAEIVRHTRARGCYVNLVTSGVGLDERRAGELAQAGVDHVQLSMQDAEPGPADEMAGIRAHRRKLAAAAVVDSLGLALTVNVVLHRGNLDRLGAIVELAAEMGADRVELAHTQYYGWGLRNRAALMPTPAQLADAEAVVAAARERFGDRPVISYVTADYHEPYPKPCMHGWASRQLTITPDGAALPCPAASVITNLPRQDVTRVPLRRIWYESETFTAFRGTSWMREPCRSCPRQEIDFGGCRCQAYQLTGDAAESDPICSRSPHRPLVDAVLASPPSSSSVLTPRRVTAR